MKQTEIKKFFDKNHLNILVRELLEETSEFSRTRGQIRYKMTGRQTPEEFVNSITWTTESKPGKSGREWLILKVSHPYIKKDGRTFQRDVTFKLLVDTDGTILHEQGTIRSFDEKEMDNRIKHMVLDSEHFVEDITAISIYI